MNILGSLLGIGLGCCAVEKALSRRSRRKERSGQPDTEILHHFTINNVEVQVRRKRR